MTESTLKDSDVQQFLKFTLPDETFAMVKSQNLTEILSLDLKQIISIPDVHPALLGVYNWRGEVLWLLDLGFYLGSEALNRKNLSMGKLEVVVVHDQGQVLGLTVKKVDEMVKCPMDKVQVPPKTELSPTLKASLEGYWLDQNHQVTWVLGAQRLIESLA